MQRQSRMGEGIGVEKLKCINGLLLAGIQPSPSNPGIIAQEAFFFKKFAIDFKIMFLDCVIGRRGITILPPAYGPAKNMIFKSKYPAAVVFAAPPSEEQSADTPVHCLQWVHRLADKGKFSQTLETLELLLRVCRSTSRPL